MKKTDSRSIENLFDDIAIKYDFLNDLFSMGLHRIWKTQLIKWLNPLPGEYWLDLCCGTGDMALRLGRKLKDSGKVVGLDSASIPILLAEKRAQRESLMSISWVKGDALNTTLKANKFDGCVMAYGLRNLSDPLEGLSEIYRVLKPGGRAGLLDFNNFRGIGFGSLFQKYYLRNVVVPIASRIGFQSHYSYLEESIMRFPDCSQLKDMALDIGFNKVDYRYLAAGQMGVLLLTS